MEWEKEREKTHQQQHEVHTIAQSKAPLFFFIIGQMIVIISERGPFLPFSCCVIALCVPLVFFFFPLSLLLLYFQLSFSFLFYLCLWMGNTQSRAPKRRRRQRRHYVVFLIPPPMLTLHMNFVCVCIWLYTPLFLLLPPRNSSLSYKTFFLRGGGGLSRENLFIFPGRASFDSLSI